MNYAQDLRVYWCLTRKISQTAYKLRLSQELCKKLGDIACNNNVTMRTKPILENHFYQDGRGPELQRVHWLRNGIILKGFEYYNPDDKHDEEKLKNIALVGVQGYFMATEEVHGNILASADSNAAIVEVLSSEWLIAFHQTHLSSCKHFQIMFYDEIYDVICENILAGLGKLR